MCRLHPVQMPHTISSLTGRKCFNCLMSVQTSSHELSLTEYSLKAHRAFSEYYGPGVAASVLIAVGKNLFLNAEVLVNVDPRRLPARRHLKWWWLGGSGA